MRLIDTETYERSQPLRMAYLDGKLDLCEQIRELVQIIIARNNVSPHKPTSDYEEGQVAALSAIVEALQAIEQGADKQTYTDTAYDA
jgi:hypothetical protein